MSTPDRPTSSPVSRRMGLLGGMSWESTAPYYTLINQEVGRRLGGLHSARILLDSVDFAEIEELQATGEWERAGQLLAAEAAALERAGAELLVLCTNTMHIVADQIQGAITIPLLHIIDVVAGVIARQGIDTVGLLGTAFTMEQPFYRDRLAAHGINVLTPPPADRRMVHRVIYDELCRGQVHAQSREAYGRVIADLARQGAAGVILGCTEIELLLTSTHLHGVPLFPTTRLHALAAVEAALENHTEG